MSTRSQPNTTTHAPCRRAHVCVRSRAWTVALNRGSLGLPGAAVTMTLPAGAAAEIPLSDHVFYMAQCPGGGAAVHQRHHAGLLARQVLSFSCSITGPESASGVVGRKRCWVLSVRERTVAHVGVARCRVVRCADFLQCQLSLAVVRGACCLRRSTLLRWRRTRYVRHLRQSAPKCRAVEHRCERLQHERVTA